MKAAETGFHRRAFCHLLRQPLGEWRSRLREPAVTPANAPSQKVETTGNDRRGRATAAPNDGEIRLSPPRPTSLRFPRP